jgi:ABC-2 type transport system ATP-binding protein
MMSDRSPSGAMLEVRNLYKNFGPLVAVDHVSFKVNRGEVLGLLGPNGAGKSTTMKMIAGFLTPVAGTAIVCGHDIQRQPLAAKRQIGYLPEGASAYLEMTVASFLEFVAQIRGMRGAEATARIDHVVELLGLGYFYGAPIETLSKGYRRRVGVAQALIHDPPVIVLDEPTDGLDPNQKYELRKIIAAMQPEKAIVISTHLGGGRGGVRAGGDHRARPGRRRQHLAEAHHAIAPPQRGPARAARRKQGPGAG